MALLAPMVEAIYQEVLSTQSIQSVRDYTLADGGRVRQLVFVAGGMLQVLTCPRILNVEVDDAMVDFLVVCLHTFFCTVLL